MLTRHVAQFTFRGGYTLPASSAHITLARRWDLRREPCRETRDLLQQVGLSPTPSGGTRRGQNSLRSGGLDDIPCRLTASERPSTTWFFGLLDKPRWNRGHHWRANTLPPARSNPKTRQKIYMAFVPLRFQGGPCLPAIKYSLLRAERRSTPSPNLIGSSIPSTSQPCRNRPVGY